MDNTALTTWVMDQLEASCEEMDKCDIPGLASYIVGLVDRCDLQGEGNTAELEESLQEKLEVFLKDNTTQFVDNLVDLLESTRSSRRASGRNTNRTSRPTDSAGTVDEEDDVFVQLAREGVTKVVNQAAAAVSSQSQNIPWEPPKKRRGKSKHLPAHIAQKLGEANMHYIQNKFTEALELLFEVVRLAPDHVEAYHTLGLIFEGTGQVEQAMQFYMIAAQLGPKDSELWQQLWQMSNSLKKSHQAHYCLSRALKANPANDALLAEFLQVTKNASHRTWHMNALKSVLTARNNETTLGVELAQLYHAAKDPANALKILDKCFVLSANEADLNVANMICELHLELNKYDACEKHVLRLANHMPLSALPLDITVKYAIALIHLNKLPAARAFIDQLLEDTSDEYDDLCLDLGTSLLACSHHTDALTFFEKLLASEKHENNPQLHILSGQCYQHSNMLENATTAYQKALEISPGHVEAALLLARLFRHQEKHEQALQVLSTALNVAKLSSDDKGDAVRVAIERAQHLLALNRMDEFVNDAWDVTKSCLDQLRADQVRRGTQRKLKLGKSAANPQTEQGGDAGSESESGSECSVDNNNNNTQLTADVMRLDTPVVRRKRTTTQTADPPSQTAVSILGPDQFFDMLYRLVRELTARTRYNDAFELIHTVLRLRINVVNPNRRKDLKVLATVVAFHMQDYLRAFKYVRDVCRERPYDITLWNFFSRFLSNGEVLVAQRKFLHRLLVVHPNSVPLITLLGNTCAMAGSYRLALGMYFRAYQKIPDDPFLNLITGISLLGWAMNKAQPNRHGTVVRAFAFLFKYHRLCDNKNEANYNIGRALHHLGLYHMAMPFYHKAISCDGGTLSREAAFNLSLIYRSTGNVHMARVVLRDHITV